MSGDMKPEEGGSEPGTSQELLQRLRELEAENSALAQANENQRETYERCLDEVANHVVQALLNQKDLRQECIKLKKRVFDLERQNQSLSDLFQQKLQLATGSLPQLALHPVPSLCSPSASLQLGSVEKLAPSLPLGRCALPREAVSPGSQPLEALSPFFKKKAQILEVLRKLEETDPLLCPPPWREPSYSPTKPGFRHCQPVPGSPPESPLNGEGPPAEPLAATHQQWPPCLLLAQTGLEEVLKWKGEEEEGQGGSLEAEGGRPQLLPPLCCQQKGEGSSSSSSDELGEPGPLEKGPPGEALQSALAQKKLELGLLLEDTECYLQHFLKEGCPLNGEPVAAYRLEGPLEALGPPSGALSRDMLTGLSAMGRYQPIKPASGLAQASADKPAFGTVPGEQDLGPFPEAALERQAYLSVCLAGDEPPEKSAKGKPKLQLGPTSPGGGALPLPSPSKMLRLLRIPTPGEKPQGPNPLRLSPQLTRSSKIPCRSNNYEVCPSPGLSRRASPEGPVGPACPLPPGAGAQASPKAGRPLAPATAEGAVHSPEPFSHRSLKAHDYENISELSVGGLASPPELPKCSRSTPVRGARPDAPPCPPELCPYALAKERGTESPPPTRRTAGDSAGPRKPGSGTGKKQPEPGHLPFKERLSALGKLKRAEAGERKEAPGLEKNSCPGKARAPGRPCEEALEARAQPRPGAGGSLKHQEQCRGGEAAGRCYSSGSVGSRLEAEACSAKHYAAKARQPGALCPAGTPLGTRNPLKAPPVPPAKSTKSPHGSPTKLPSKSPTKAAAKPGAARLPAEEPKPGSPKRPPTPPPGAGRKVPDSAKAPALHSAIEEKVMKGIEENMLRLQGQDKGPAGEGKPKNSSGIASWFGLRKSKLPALSRRPEALKAKEERKERGPGPLPSRREGKAAACKLEAESLNISRLMEKAEDLRKALEEEKAYLNGLALEKGRPHACGVLVEQTQSELQVMYQEVTAENFMQQLLNRVDGKEAYENRLEQKRELRDFQRVSQDAKDPRLFRPPRNGIVGHLRSCEETPEQSPDAKLREEIPSDESLAESVSSQHFTACGSLTRTLDSGIGTFPPPDYCSGAPSKNLPKPKPSLDPLPSVALGQPPGATRVPRKARTLEREVPSAEDVLAPGKHQSMPAFHGVLASAEPLPSLHGRTGCPEGLYPEPCVETGRARRAGQSKNWTFPNSKACSGAADPFLCTARDLAGLHGLGGGSVCSTAERKRASSDVPHLLPPSSLAFGGSRTPSASDVGEEGSTDLKSRDTGQGQPGLENSESLSDSLYDSLSSCGSQG